VNWHAPINAGESRANLELDKLDRRELDEKIRTALGYMRPERIANYLGVSLAYVHEVRDHTPYYRVKDLRDRVPQRRVG
jgi:hypothetical protein